MSKKQREMRIPSSAKDLRIKHYKSMGLVPQNGFKDFNLIIHFLAAFTGLRYNQLLDFDAKDIKRAVAIALTALSKLDLTSALPKEIALAGESYYLIEPSKVGIGWHIDFQSCDIEKDPVRLACMFYVQEDFNYSDVDENGNILFPIDSRQKIFEEHFPLDLFMRAAGFFLKRSLNLARKSLVIENISMKTRINLVTRVINPFSGKRLLKPLWIRSIFLGIKRSNSITEPSRTDANISNTKE